MSNRKTESLSLYFFFLSFFSLGNEQCGQAGGRWLFAMYLALTLIHPTIHYSLPSPPLHDIMTVFFLSFIRS